ncbi:hypothetical protein [Mangrovicella endophytica]|uniref:hypothetical protein n=1 Tax=Mangrovicella endophytica TaxID=2066697 RepID=UPI000C9DB310|nr:hypothetical protein [Mangrovicella endophytica]
MSLFARHDSPVIGALFFLLWGPILWAGHLTIAYGGQALLCTLAASSADFDAATAIRLLIGVTTLASGLASVFGAVVPRLPFRLLLRRRPVDADDGTLIGIMRLLSALASLGILFAGVTTAVLPVCAQGR